MKYCIGMREKRAKKFLYAGVHIVADFWFGKTIENPIVLRRILLQSAKEANSTPLKISIHAFSPQGITGIALLAESHIAIHSWPEIKYLAIDIFTCGENAKPLGALEFLKKSFCPKKVIVKRLKRGKVTKDIGRNI